MGLAVKMRQHLPGNRSLGKPAIGGAVNLFSGLRGA
jgi:ornithine cyclodeaminase